MKTKISAVILATCAGMIMVFAAKPADPCTEKYNSCSDTCTNQQAGCKARGSDPSTCEKNYQKCMQSCDKAKKDCEGGAKPK